MKRIDKATKEREERKARKDAEKRKKRDAEPDLQREAPTQEEKPTILIVCEGENTEPSYFKSFKVATVRLVINPKIQGGHNTLSLVKLAEKLQKKDTYNEVWCVFDKDSFADQQFNEAVQRAEKQNFRVGYSNQSFEYWLLLHFEDHQGGQMPRHLYYGKINAYLADYGVVYNKDSKKITTDFFELLQAYEVGKVKTREELAIERAKRNHETHKTQGNSPAQSESCTTVYELVEEIRKYL